MHVHYTCYTELYIDMKIDKLNESTCLTVRANIDGRGGDVSNLNF